MNALATNGPSQNGLLAALALPTANGAPATAAFVNMISLFLTSPNQAVQHETAPTDQSTPIITASPAQIANAMIRSMMGNATTTSSAPAPAPILSAPNSTSAVIVNQAVPSPAPVVDSGATSVATTVVAKGYPSAPPKTQATLLPRKQSPGTNDLPQATAEIVAAAPVVSAPLPVISASAPAVPVTPSSTAPTSVAPIETKAPLPANLPVSEIAFTAILTPMKDAAAAAIAPDTAKPIAAPPATNAPPQTPESQTVSASAAWGSATDGQQSGDTPSRHQQGETGAQPSAIATETKIKPASVSLNNHQDENAPQAAVLPGPIDIRTVAAVPSFMGQIHTAAPTLSDAGHAVATPSQSTAEALRTLESNLPAAAPLRTGAAQEISIRIAQPDAAPVDLRIVERAGQVHVDVRTSDAGMQTSLRQDLGTLTSTLQRAGYHTETITPSSTLNRTAQSSQTGNQDTRQDSNRGGSGGFAGGQRQRQQQKHPGTWLGEMENQQ